jgi:hypothetical protein
MSEARSAWPTRAARSLRVRTVRWRGPDFLVLGAQKAATTSLFEWLHRHPQTRLPAKKELHYFNKPEPPPLAAYRAHFAIGRRSGRTRGEATPDYLFSPFVPRLVVQAFDDLRYIVVLRDPAERAHAHYRMVVSWGLEPLSFLDALEAEPERLARCGWPGPPASNEARLELDRRSYAARGDYAEQLERWWTVAPREHFLLLRFEDLVAQPQRFAATIQEFLGLRTELTGDEWPHMHAGAATPRDSAADDWLRARFAEPNRRLEELTGMTWPSRA